MIQFSCFCFNHSTTVMFCWFIGWKMHLIELHSLHVSSQRSISPRNCWIFFLFFFQSANAKLPVCCGWWIFIPLRVWAGFLAPCWWSEQTLLHSPPTSFPQPTSPSNHHPASSPLASATHQTSFLCNFIYKPDGWQTYVKPPLHRM